MDLEDQTFETVICPFCPLHCDGVRIERDKFISDCELADGQFDSAVHLPSARIDQTSSGSLSFAQVVESANLPNCPVVQVGSVSLEEAKLLQDLASRNKLVLSTEARPTTDAIAGTLARDGGFLATLSDVRAHADFLWLIGSTENVPKLPETLRLKAKQESGATVLKTPRLDISSIEHLLKEADANESEPVSQATQMFRSSRYAALVMGDEAFESGKELVSSELLLRLIQRWAESPLSPGNSQHVHRVVLTFIDGHQNLHAVFRWRENSVPRFSTAPHIRIGAPRETDNNRADLQIGGIDPGSELATTYLPCSTTGIHRRGTTLRGDGSVTLPLASILKTDHPHWTDLLTAILE